MNIWQPSLGAADRDLPRLERVFREKCIVRICDPTKIFKILQWPQIMFDHQGLPKICGFLLPGNYYIHDVHTSSTDALCNNHEERHKSHSCKLLTNMKDFCFFKQYFSGENHSPFLKQRTETVLTILASNEQSLHYSS